MFYVKIISANQKEVYSMKKTVIVTGGARGIGRAICTSFAADYNVIINYNSSKKEAEQLRDELSAKGCSAEVFGADISKSTEADALVAFAVDTFGSVDVLVNNSGVADFGLFTDMTDEEYRRIMSVDLDGTFYTSRAAAREMIKKHSGAIVNISSMWGITGASCEAAYSAAKAGVIGLTKALSKELGPSGIRVNCIAPGVINTEMNKRLSAEDLTALAEETPLCRLGEPFEVAEAVLFLASDKASFITGQTLSVDGGFVV